MIVVILKELIMSCEITNEAKNVTK